MKRLLVVLAIAALSTFALSACGVPVATTPAPNECRVTVHAPKYSNFDVYGAAEASCQAPASTIYMRVQILFWTFWGWRTLGIGESPPAHNTTYTSATAAWPCKGWSKSDRHEFKTSVTGYEIFNGLVYDQIPNPAESGSSFLNCDPMDGW